ncbi:uncharacterized protein LOC130676397 [Microplitis mediator]|uniref:uncharacterized protein LOC130676397 n=1 Tax=Microplitis mediator TaxID=375433 RepID=UPI002552B4B4|nr:uncharacterized protein LOC130676397 [Microplitis mediator]
MHVIIQGRESIFPNEASDLTIIGNCLRHSGISITVDAFVEKFSSTVRFLLKTINAANAESPTEMTPVIYSFGQAGSGKSTTMFGNREKRIPGLGKCLFPGVDAADLRFRAQEWLLLGSQKFRFRDIVSAQDPSVWKGSLISWDTLTWGEFNQFWPIMKKRLGEKSGVKFSFRGVLIMEIERKSTQKRAFFIDIPGFDREENAGQASSKSRS